MKELEFIKTIKNTLKDSSYIGNDCADLKDCGLFVTQDTLVEDVHFKLSTTTPFQLGQKAVAVNISDLAVNICNPAFISIGLSLPENTSEDFVKDFYSGVNAACEKYNVVVTGGDITVADKVFISITAIGRRRHSINISRSFAKPGYFILSTGNYGTSAAGLYALTNKLKVSDEIINAHLVPEAKLEDAYQVGRFVEEDIAAMDTSDGLADALYKISKASNVSIKVNFDDIPVLDGVKQLANSNNVNLEDWVLFGGEDYELIFCVSYYIFSSLDINQFKYIGYIEENTDGVPVVEITNKDKKFVIDEEMLARKSFNHFGG